MNCVVSHRSDTGIGEVIDHGQIWHEEEQDEKNPTAVIPLIGEEAGDEHGGTFEVEKWSGVHRLRHSSFSNDEVPLAATPPLSLRILRIPYLESPFAVAPVLELGDDSFEALLAGQAEELYAVALDVAGAEQDGRLLGD